MGLGMSNDVIVIISYGVGVEKLVVNEVEKLLKIGLSTPTQTPSPA